MTQTAEPNTGAETITTLEHSLFEVADKAGDITPHIYTNYFARCEGSEALMVHIEDRVRGRMLEEVFRLLLEEELSDQDHYLRFETKTHIAYGVEPVMYENLFMAVRDTVKNLLGSAWTPEYEQAWQLRIQVLLAALNRAIDSDS